MKAYIPGARLIPAQEAMAIIETIVKPHASDTVLRFVVDRELCLGDEYDRSGVLELPNGTVIDGGLKLDFDASNYQGQTFRGIVVLGDLDITGDILAEDCDAGPFLVVCGRLRVRNIIKGGAPIIVGGRVTAEGIIFCFYNNHGCLRAYGGLKAQGLLVDDQQTDIKEPIEVRAMALDSEGLARVLVEDLLAEDEDGQILPMDDVSDEIISRMKSDKPVLR